MRETQKKKAKHIVKLPVELSHFLHRSGEMMKTDGRKVPIGIRWTSLLLKCRHSVLAFWFCIVWPCGLIGTARFLDNTVSLSSIFPDIKTTKDSPKEVLLKSRGMQQYAFHLLLEQNDWDDSSATLIDGHSMLYNNTKRYVLNIEGRLRRYWEDKYNFSQGVDKDFDINVASYYTFYERGLKILSKEMFVANGGLSTFVSVEMPVRKAVPRRELEAAARQVSTENTPLGVSVMRTGWDSLDVEARNGAENDMKIVHYVSAPLAAAVLVLFLGSFHLLLVPLLTMATTFLGTSAIMAIISTRVQVWDFAPTLMGATTAALSIDYCLFLLSRLLEERKTSESIDVSIQQTVQHSGHTILVSGLVLAGCCFGYLLLPFQFQSSFGVVFPVLILVSVCVNLTLVPALLYVMFGSTQCQTSVTGLFAVLCDHHVSKRSIEREKVATPEVNTSVGKHTNVDDCLGTTTFAFSKRVVQPKFGGTVLAVVTVLMLSAASNVRHMKTGFSSNLQFLRNGQSLQTFNRIGELFGFGIVYENEIWFLTPEPDQPIGTRTRFETIHSVLEELTGDQFPATSTIDHYASITTLGGKSVPIKTYQEALECGLSCTRESLRTLAFLSDTAFDFAGHDTTRTMVMLNIDPSSSEGIEWMDEARTKLELLKQSGAMGDLDYLQAGVPEIYLSNAITMERFPLVVATAFLVVFLLMGVFFRSIVIPFLSLLSVLLTQGFVYGSAVCVYQYGVLNFLGVPGLSSVGAGEIHFFIPVMTFTLVLGLGLDYDTFVIGRVAEYRELGFTLQSSIVLSLCKTRQVVTAAGLVMGVSFGGLLLSGAAFVNQFAFLMVSAVLMDTFVVRTTILPILLGMFGEAAFWPRQFPTPTICILNDGSFPSKVEASAQHEDEFDKLLVVKRSGDDEETL